MLNRYAARLLNRASLMVLPDVETILSSIAKALRTLDRVTTRIEQTLADNAVRLAEDIRTRREAIEAIEADFARREERTLSAIENTRLKLERAGAARDAVSDMLARL